MTHISTTLSWFASYGTIPNTSSTCRIYGEIG